MEMSQANMLPPASLKELNNFILNDTVKKYSKNSIGEKELMSVLSSLKNENDMAINSFRELIVTLTNELSQITGDSTIKQHKAFIIEMIQAHSKFFVDAFIKKGYNNNNGMYRQHIISQNEEFFLNNSLDDITEGKTNFIDKLFQFKSFWSKLKDENKMILKYYLITLCSLSDVRYINFNRYLLIKQMNTADYKQIFDKYDPII